MKLKTLFHRITEHVAPRFGRCAEPVIAPTLSGAVRFPYGPFQFTTRLPPGAHYELQASTNLHIWTAIAKATAAVGTFDYVDSEACKHSWRFYRVVANGVLSDNVIGYATTTLPPGFSLVANPLRTANSSVAELFKGWPDGTTLNTFDPRLLRFSLNSVEHGRWVKPDERLAPGEGAFFFNPTEDYKSHSFVGTLLLGNLSKPIHKGLSLCGSLVPQPGQLHEDLHFPVSEGDVIHLFDRDRQQYVLHPWTDGKWQNGAPILSVGEAFWVAKTSASN